MTSLSVIVPVFNGAPFLEEALASVLRSPLVNEIILVDDGSTDGTAAVAQTLGDRVRYFHQENRGPAAARNFGLAQARAEFIAFIDADDVWSDAHPAAALAELERTGADLVFGETQCISAGAVGDGFEPFGPCFHTFHLGSAICRRALFETAGAFNETMRLGEDVDWFLRVRDGGGSIMSLPELSLYYRVHEGNRARIHDSSRAGLLNALHHSLERRRNAVALRE